MICDWTLDVSETMGSSLRLQQRIWQEKTIHWMIGRIFVLCGAVVHKRRRSKVAFWIERPKGIIGFHIIWFEYNFFCCWAWLTSKDLCEHYYKYVRKKFERKRKKNNWKSITGSNPMRYIFTSLHLNMNEWDLKRNLFLE